MTPIEAFPLTWPVGWTRTPLRERVRQSRLTVSEEKALRELLVSVRLLGGKDIVVSTNKPLRRDGMMMRSAAEPDDSGVAVYWTWRDKPQVMACDRWMTVRENLRSIGLAIDGLRAIERSGASQILERAFTGFAALPMKAGRAWRDVLGVVPKEIVTDTTLKRLYRQKVVEVHPDHGGSVEAFQEVQRAYEDAVKEIAGG